MHWILSNECTFFTGIEDISNITFQIRLENGSSLSGSERLFFAKKRNNFHDGKMIGFSSLRNQSCSHHQSSTRLPIATFRLSDIFIRIQLKFLVKVGSVDFQQDDLQGVCGGLQVGPFLFFFPSSLSVLSRLVLRLPLKFNLEQQRNRVWPTW